MTSKERESLLWIVAGAAVGLLLLNYARARPGDGRLERAERAHRRAAKKGRRAAGRCSNAKRSSATIGRRCCARTCRPTIRRPRTTRSRRSTAGRPTAASLLTSVTPQHQTREDSGYDAFEYRMAATGRPGGAGAIPVRSGHGRDAVQPGGMRNHHARRARRAAHAVGAVQFRARRCGRRQAGNSSSNRPSGNGRIEPCRHIAVQVYSCCFAASRCATYGFAVTAAAFPAAPPRPLPTAAADLRRASGSSTRATFSIPTAARPPAGAPAAAAPRPRGRITSRSPASRSMARKSLAFFSGSRAGFNKVVPAGEQRSPGATVTKITPHEHRGRAQGPAPRRRRRPDRPARRQIRCPPPRRPTPAAAAPAAPPPRGATAPRAPHPPPGHRRRAASTANLDEIRRRMMERHNQDQK